MDETQQRDGEAMNWLLQGANDSAQGFRQGASLARNPKLQALFAERAQQREALAAEIAAEVRSFQQPPTEGGSVIGEAHRAFTYLRDAISHESDKGLVEELLRRERALTDKFQTAAQDTQLPSPARTVAARVLPSFAETTAELTGLAEEFAGGSPENTTPTARFNLSDEDNGFLAAPGGSTVLSVGAGGTESSLERSQDTVVRIGIKSVAVATSAGGVLSVAIEAGDAAANGRDGPAPIEHHLAASQSVEVLVRAGAPLRFKAEAAPQDAQLLRTVVWSLDVDAVERRPDEPRVIESGVDENVAAAEDYARVTT